MPTNATVPDLSNENLNQILDTLKTLQTIYSGINLTSEERRKLRGLGPNNLPFALQVLDELKINPTMTHPSVNPTVFNANMTIFNNLQTAISALQSYIEGLKDAQLFLADQISDQASLVTDYIKTMSKGDPIITESYKRLSKLRKQKKKKNSSLLDQNSL